MQPDCRNSREVRRGMRSISAYNHPNRGYLDDRLELARDTRVHEGSELALLTARS